MGCEFWVLVGVVVAVLCGSAFTVRFVLLESRGARLDHERSMRDMLDRVLSSADLSLDAKRIEAEQKAERPKPFTTPINLPNPHMSDDLDIHVPHEDNIS